MSNPTALWMDPAAENPSPQDARLSVRFHMGALLDGVATEREGCPKYNEVPFITIAVPGDRSVLLDRPVWDDDRNPNSDTRRWPREWKAWREGHGEDIVTGTPLTEWPAISRAQVEELAWRRIRTVEQLAGLSDANAQGFMGSLALRQKAQDYLEHAKGVAPLARLRAEAEAKTAEIDELKRALREQAEKVEQLGKQKGREKVAA